jgi:hypothetical protein
MVMDACNYSQLEWKIEASEGWSGDSFPLPTFLLAQRTKELTYFPLYSTKS